MMPTTVHHCVPVTIGPKPPARSRGFAMVLGLLSALLLGSALRPSVSVAQDTVQEASQEGAQVEPPAVLVPSEMALARLQDEGGAGGELDPVVRLDLMYLVAADHEEWVDSLQMAVDSGLELARAQGADSTITAGYLGALEVLRAKHGTWPPSRVKWVRRGVGRLDELVEQNPTDPHLRYLLTVSTLFLPGFMARGDEARSDLEVLAELLVQTDAGPAVIAESSANDQSVQGAQNVPGASDAVSDPPVSTPAEIHQRAAAFVLEYGDWLSADLLERVAATQTPAEVPVRSEGRVR